MANKTITIAWANGSPRFNPPPGVTNLHGGDTVTVQLVGAPSGASIDQVTIFNNTEVNGEDAKGTTVICSWTRGAPYTCVPYSFQADSPTQVVITDVEHPAADDKYWFSVAGSPNAWSLDPELINKPDGGGG